MLVIVDETFPNRVEALSEKIAPLIFVMTNNQRETYDFQ